MTGFKTQTGVALITALMVVAIAVMLASSLLDELHLDRQRTYNIINNEQAYLYGLGAEVIARAGLRLDRQNNKFDSLNELWAQPTPPYPLEGGHIAAVLEDLQGRFNLNNLSPGLNTNYQQDLERFRRLLTALKIDPQLADAVIDWLDDDLITTIPAGAEDDYYMGLLIPYRTANGLMSSPSELRAVKGFNEEDTYATIEPYICTLPVVTSININTARTEMLQSLNADITASDAQTIIAYRDGDTEKGIEGSSFEELDKFKEYMQTTLNKNNFSTDGMTTATDFFLLTSYAEIGRGKVQLYSIIQRNDKGDSSIVSRSQGAW
ncbi:MAG: type II secretion system minor pseudopilin GspK [Gammaproteobacteria bacterium]|nr:type II secretion system minor pseudopilin GspK [Gammaproteobacteria bacterium]